MPYKTTFCKLLPNCPGNYIAYTNILYMLHIQTNSVLAKINGFSNQPFTLVPLMHVVLIQVILSAGTDTNMGLMSIWVLYIFRLTLAFFRLQVPWELTKCVSKMSSYPNLCLFLYEPFMINYSQRTFLRWDLYFKTPYRFASPTKDPLKTSWSFRSDTRNTVEWYIDPTPSLL